jgi:GTPase SAR1 family protein
MTVRKILFLGPPEAGKTSLRKFLFEGVAAEDLLAQSEAPTIGLKYSTYNYVQTMPTDKEKKKGGEKVPVDLSVVDAAGQNLADWLDEKKERVFPGCDVIFLIFDVSDWLDDEKRSEIEDLIMNVYNARVELAPESSFFIIGHKADLLPEGQTYREQMVKRIKKELNDYVFDKMMKYLDFAVYITSIKEEFAQDAFLTLLNLTVDLIGSAAPAEEEEKSDIQLDALEKRIKKGFE